MSDRYRVGASPGRTNQGCVIRANYARLDVNSHVLGRRRKIARDSEIPHKLSVVFEPGGRESARLAYNQQIKVL